MRNWLIYRVYHEGLDRQTAQIIARWCAIFILSHVNQFMDAGWFSAATGGYFRLFVMFERWRESENAVLIRQQFRLNVPQIPCFMRFHCCLATLSGRFSRPYRLRKLSCKPSQNTRHSPRKTVCQRRHANLDRGAFLPYLLYMYRYQDYPATAANSSSSTTPRKAINTSSTPDQWHAGIL